TATSSSRWAPTTSASSSAASRPPPRRLVPANATRVGAFSRTGRPRRMPAMVVRQDLPAQLGRYRVLSRIGAGGMAAVYLAEDTVLGRRVALKVPHFGPEDDPAVRERFSREARAAARVEHPNVCPVLDVGREGDIDYLVMPYVEGTPLSRLVGPASPWP